MNTYTVYDPAARTVSVYNQNKVLLSSRPATAEEIAEADVRAAENTAATNKDALLAKAAAAIASNITFLGITSPTAAQVTAQVQKLTRQMNAQLKIAVNDLQNQNGT